MNVTSGSFQTAVRTTMRSSSSATATSRAGAVGYLRRSTDRQEQSIPDQRQAVERFAAEQGLTLSRFYTDDAISGTSTAGRRAFQEMIADAQKSPSPFSHIVVYDVKRFGRLDNDEAGYWRHILRTHGVEVLYASENFSGDGTDDLLRPVKQWQAREESKDLSKVTIRGLLSKVAGGSWMGGVPPYGYDLRYRTDRATNPEFLFTLRFLVDGTKQLLDHDGKLVRSLERGESIQITKRDHAYLAPSSAERVVVVQRIFRLSAEENRGLRSIADALNCEHIETPRGPAWSRIYQGSWTASSVRSILTNPMYVGDMVWNRRTDARFHRISEGRALERRDAYGARLVPNPESDWIRIENTHPPLVSRRLFELAREARESRPTSKRQRGPQVSGGWKGSRSRFLLSGLVWCARCGGRYEGTSRTKGRARIDGSRVRTHYYGCGNYIRRGRSTCSFGPIEQQRLESIVVERVLSHFERMYGKSTEARLIQAVQKGLGCESQDVLAARARAQAEKCELDTKVANLLDNITTINRELVDQRLQVLVAKKEELERRISELERISLGATEVNAIVQEAWGFLTELRASLLHGPPEKRIRSIRQCLSKIVVNADDWSLCVQLLRVPCAGLRSVFDEQTFTLTTRPAAGAALPIQDGNPSASAKIADGLLDIA